MRRARLGLATLASILSVGAAATTALAGNIESEPDGMTHMSVAQARAYATAAGGTVRAVEDLDDGSYEMTIDYPDGIPVYVVGVDCTGAGEAKLCTEFQTSAWFVFDDAAEALTMEHTLDILWLSDKQIENAVKVWRYEFVSGMTEAHLKQTFSTFLETVWAAMDIVYPRSPDSVGKSASG